jgi:glutamate formiminotransferase/formiminotetrahydrofolate cyclodeaminase
LTHPTGGFVKLIECVPNFSEGRDPSVIDAITGAITATEGAVLLDVDPGAATNRTVVTFVGSPEAVEEAAFQAIRTAAALIDMTKHHGEHPRMGATDVCPFVPLQDVTMDECVALARRLGRRVGEELGIPVFLYEAAAVDQERSSLAVVRRGEYEGLSERTDPPDLGPGDFNPRSGATAIGAREFLIAYNINLNTRDRRLANRIAGVLRETGRPRRDETGAIVREADGTPIREPGIFKELRGVGWYIEEYGRAQLSFNLTNHKVTSLHEVFDAACREAEALGLRVTGSELVGLVPRDALLAAGDHYLTRQGATTGVAESERIHAAVLSLGLDDLAPFDPAAKVIEYRYAGAPTGLVAGTVIGFVDELSSDSPAPGGGSVAALCGSLSAGLSAMIAALTFGKKGMEESREAMEDLGRQAQALKDWFLQAVDRDTDAFNQVLTAMRMPKTTDVDITARAEAIEVANQRATGVPLEVLERGVEALELALIVARDGNPNTVTDAGVAGACALAAAEGAAFNVRINLKSATDLSWAGAAESAAADLIERCRALSAEVRETVETALSGS